MIFATLMAIGAALLYSTGLTHRLIFDDGWATRNPAILSAPISLGLQLRNLSLASFQFIFQWVGPELQWQRMFNIVIHIINGWLLWTLSLALLRRALSQEASAADASFPTEPRQSPDPSLVSVAAPVAVGLWLLNPVAVYAVQYLTQRSSLLATCFVLIGLLAFIRALQAQSVVARALWGAAVLAACALAIMSKEHAAPMVAALLPLYVFWKRPPPRHLWTAGVVALVVSVLAATALLSRKGFALGLLYEDLAASFLQQLNAIRPEATENAYSLSIINQLWLFFQYGAIWNLPWPGWMSIDVRPPFPMQAHAFPHILGPVLWLSAVCASIWALLAKSGRLALLGLLFLIPSAFFLTELAYVRLQEPFVLYRSYLWSITLPAVWAILLVTLIETKWRLVAAGVAISLACAAVSFERIQTLYDETTAWRDAVDKLDLSASPSTLGRWRAPLNLSRADLVKGNYQEALRHAQLAEKLGAPNGMAQFNSGNALLALRQPKQALHYFQLAQSKGYSEPEIWMSLAASLDQLGQTSEAISVYDQALASPLQPQNRLLVLQQVARLANAVGRFDNAKRYYQQMLSLQPNLPVAWLGLAHSSFRAGQIQPALDTLTTAISKQPLAEFFHARGMLYAQVGQRQQALQNLAEAAAREPTNPTYQSALKELQNQLKPSAGEVSLKKK